MAQYVMEFTTSSVAAALSLLDRLVVRKKSLETLDCELQSTLCFTAASGSVESLLPDLLDGKLCSVMIQSEGDIRYGLLTSPMFNGQPLSKWMGTIEFQTDEWRSTWQELLASTETTAVCVGMEEGIDLNDDILSPDLFPWHEPSLVAGAVRRSDGSWELRYHVTAS
jgi:hypothetical protein